MIRETMPEDRPMTAEEATNRLERAAQRRESRPQPGSEELRQSLFEALSSSPELLLGQPPSKEGWPINEDEQIKMLSGKMSALESLKQSYERLQYDPVFRNLVRQVRELSPQAQAYFDARIQIYEAWLITPLTGGDTGEFIKLGNLAGLMRFTNTMLHQKEVADAFMEFEIRGSKREFVDKRQDDGTVKKELNKDSNPAFADAPHLEEIRGDIALEVAKKNENLPPELADNQKQELVQKHIWAVRQAETIWRMWMRFALWDGVVFKSDTPEDVKQALSSLRATEMPDHWEEIQQYVDADNSFSGQGEFAVKRLLHSSLFFHKYRLGEQRIRPYLYFGSKDFLSSYLDDKFLTASSNFADGKAFELESNSHPDQKDPTKPDLNFDRTYVKKNEQGGVVERVVIQRNGIVRFNERYRFNLANTKWDAKGEDAYRGLFTFLSLTYADEIRKGLISPDKLARDPSLKVLLDLYGSLESFPAMNRDIEEAVSKGENPEEKIQKERNNGKIYKEDMFFGLGLGLLNFQKHDLWQRFKQRNLNFADIDDAVNMLRGRALITNEQTKEMKRRLLPLDGLNLPDFTKDFMRSLIAIHHKANTPGILMAMLMELFKQISSLK